VCEVTMKLAQEVMHELPKDVRGKVTLLNGADVIRAASKVSAVSAVSVLSVVSVLSAVSAVSVVSVFSVVSDEKVNRL
jgi:hypothetical protein